MAVKFSPPFISARNRVSQQMLEVLLALVPAVAAMVYFFGPGVLIQLLLASAVAIGTEALMLSWRKRPLKPFLTDGSAVVTAVLLALAIPPLSPWWLTTIGIVFAMIFAKHLYGGLGYNPFNPAMVGYVLLLISFPVEMTSWLPVQSLSETAVGWGTALSVIFTGGAENISLDALSAATPLDSMKTQLGQGRAYEIITNQPLFSSIAGLGWEWINVWFALGGLYLLYRRVISWQVPLAMLLAMLIISSVTYLVDPTVTATPLFHLLSGGTMLGAFFIATDPVSGSTTDTGRIIFGAGVGLLTYIIRVWGGYPDGVAFAVIIMNMLVPLIDYYTQPRVYGARD